MLHAPFSCVSIPELIDCVAVDPLYISVQLSWKMLPIFLVCSFSYCLVPSCSLNILFWMQYVLVTLCGYLLLFSPSGKCGHVTNSWLDDKLTLAGLWLFLLEVILSKERIQNYPFFLISKKMKLNENHWRTSYSNN